MKKNIKTFFLAAGLLFAFNACQDMLNTNSSLIAMEDEYKITNETEALYALNGIIYELVPVADRYVLMGELRGDLMTASEFASVELQDVNRFSVSSVNEYADKRAYYNVINNCNFLLQKLDTSLVMQNEKVLLRYHVLTKTLRAWTYFQLGQMYGKVTYFTQPILDLEASLAQYPVVELEELADILINELKPYASIFINWPSSDIVPIRIFLGDLYLYKNDYRTAAALYYDEIFDKRYVIYDNYNRWTNTNMEGVTVGHSFTYSGERIASIPGYTTTQDFHNRLVGLSINSKPSIVPSANYVRFMSEALYLFAVINGVVAAPSGDLRGTVRGSNNIQAGDAYIYLTVKGNQKCLIYKYLNASFGYDGVDPENDILTDALYIQTRIPVYRHPHLYLRFAEALNRLGKPTLAFAVLKYGLTYANVSDPLTGKVNPDELGEAFTRFPQATFFDNNRSMAARGRGNGIPIDKEFFIIPDLPAKQDSILWVEDRILEEMAAETPFEGNRFFDLLRISRRRDNHPAYMAEKVAVKYSDKDAMKAKLMDLNSWFLP